MADTNIQQNLVNHEERISKLEAKISKLEAEASINKQSATQVLKKEISIKEFMLDKKPNGMYEMGLVIAYYFEKFQNMSSFTTDDLADGFRQAKEPLPVNLSAVVYLNMKRGFLMDAKEKKNNKKAYVITSSGEKIVEDRFLRTNKK